MIEHYFNQGLLYAFIYRYYPFYNMTEGLVKLGQSIVEIILKNLIDQEQSLWNLKKYPLKDVTKSLTQQFSYKVGGSKFFYAAFANHYSAKLPSHQNTLSFLQTQSITQKTHEKLIKSVLQTQEIKHLHCSFKDRLKQIAYLQNITYHLPSINQKQIQIKKIDFLSNFINFQQPESKKNKKKNKKNNVKQKSQSVILPQLKNLEYSCSKMQEEINTQVDEFESLMLSDQQNFVLQRVQFQFNPKRSNFKQLTDVFQSKKMEEQTQAKNSQSQNKLLLRYDQVLPQKREHKMRRECNK